MLLPKTLPKKPTPIPPLIQKPLHIPQPHNLNLIPANKKNFPRTPKHPNSTLLQNLILNLIGQVRKISEILLLELGGR